MMNESYSKTEENIKSIELKLSKLCGVPIQVKDFAYKNLKKYTRLVIAYPLILIQCFYGKDGKILNPRHKSK